MTGAVNLLGTEPSECGYGLQKGTACGYHTTSFEFLFFTALMLFKTLACMVNIPTSSVTQTYFDFYPIRLS